MSLAALRRQAPLRGGLDHQRRTHSNKTAMYLLDHLVQFSAPTGSLMVFAPVNIQEKTNETVILGHTRCAEGLRPAVACSLP